MSDNQENKLQEDDKENNVHGNKLQEDDKENNFHVIMNQIKKYLGYYKIIVGVVLAAIMLFYVVTLTNEIRTMNEGLKKRIDTATNISNEKFELVQGRFNNVEGKFKNIEERFDNVEGKFKNIEERFDNIEGKFKNIEERFDNIEEKIELLSNRFDSKLGGEIGIKGKIEILNN